MHQHRSQHALDVSRLCRGLAYASASPSSSMKSMPFISCMQSAGCSPRKCCRRSGTKAGRSSRGSLTGGADSQKSAASEAGISEDARKRFGNAKSISSAQFNQEEDNSAANYEKQVMMQRCMRCLSVQDWLLVMLTAGSCAFASLILHIVILNGRSPGASLGIIHDADSRRPSYASITCAECVFLPCSVVPSSSAIACWNRRG